MACVYFNLLLYMLTFNLGYIIYQFIYFQRGFTPLHEAVKKGHIEIIEMLLERKSDVNAVGKVCSLVFCVRIRL